VKKNSLEYLQKKNPAYIERQGCEPIHKKYKANKSTKTQVKRWSSLEQFKK
jgi:hypothetical protein